MKRTLLLRACATLVCSLFFSGILGSDSPSLSIARSSAGTLLLSWTNSATGFILEQRPNFLPGTLWTSASEMPQQQGGEFQVSVSFDQISRFFRLRLIPASEPQSDLSAAATPAPKGVSTLVGEASRFLYSGTNAVQTGVSPNTIETKRAAVIRGKVKANDGSPLAGVGISVMNHPEFGQTITRTNGNYDFAVNGGGALVVNYFKPGYCPVHRELQVQWERYSLAPDVVLMAMDPLVTQISFGSSAPFQTAESSIQNDKDGIRHALLVFKPGTTAGLVLPGGSTQTMSTLHIRATEFTVGTNGPAAMPAFLPPLSGYTYCVELSADEEEATGAVGVVFNQPVVTYTENFLKFPIGLAVPVGFYDRTKAQWIAAPNGRVVKIVSITGGAADVDTDGDGNADNGLAFTLDERKALATAFAAGQSLWRVSVPHFSAEDSNWALTTPSDASGPGTNGAGPDPNDPQQDPCKSSGTIIECENQVLGDAMSIVGTPFTLNYRSDRVPGRVATRDIRVSGSSVPASLASISVHLAVAGRSFDSEFPANPNQKMTFLWDRTDAYGRTVLGGQNLDITIDYNYPTTYTTPGPFPAAFNQTGGTTLAANPSRQQIKISDHFSTLIGEGLTDARTIGLGGWTLDVHQVLDPSGRVLHTGDGGRRRAASIGRIITAIDVPGQKVMTGIDAAPDGTLYVASPKTDTVIRIAPDGTQTVFAGTGVEGFSGDGGPANQAQLGDPFGVRVGPDGSVYISEESNNRIRRVTPDGLISTFAGTGAAADNGDGGPASAAGIFFPIGIAFGPDGSLYVIAANSRIRRITTDGMITTVAGNGTRAFSGDNGPAINASIQAINLAVARDGTLFIADLGNGRVRQVGTDGIIKTVVDYSGEHGHPTAVALDPSGNLLIGVKFDDARTPQLDLRKADGTLVPIAGGGASAVVSGVPSTQANLVGIGDIIASPDGGVYLARFDSSSLILRVGPAISGAIAGDNIIASPDGAQLFVFDDNGRHLQTVNAFTGAELFSFQYDSSGLLSSVTERTGGTDNITTIEHDAAGNPTAITGPYGQKTKLTVDANGFLATVTNPAGEQQEFGYSADGLLTSYTDPLGHVSSFTYDANGLLINDADAAGGFQRLERTTADDKFTVTRTTALNRVTTYSQETLGNGLQQHTITAPDGSTYRTTDNADAGTSHIEPGDGSSGDIVLGPDPRFGMQVPIQSSVSMQMPSGLQFTSTTERSAVLSKATDPLSVATLSQITTVGGHPSTNVFTAADRTVVATTATGRKQTRTLDALGRLASSQIAGLVPSFGTYDKRGRLASITHGTGPDARNFVFTYNPAGFMETASDPLGRTARFDYDAAGRLITQTLPGGAVFSFGYDAAGNLVRVTPPGRAAHTFTYSDRGDLISMTPPVVGSGESTIITYDADRAITSIDRGGLKKIDNTYDTFGRRVSRTGAGAGGTDKFQFDGSGRLSETTSADNVDIAYSYDGPLLTAVNIKAPFNANLKFTYDNSLLVASETINDANPINLAYDNDSLLVRAGDLAVAYDPQHGLPISSTLGVVTDQRTYNPFGELTDYAVRVGGNTVFRTTFTRDALGRTTQKAETIGGASQSFSYSYDAAGELISTASGGATVEQYSYDTNGNRVTASIQGAAINSNYDAQDRLTQSGNAVFTFDAAGYLASKASGGQTTTYNYDAFGNLRSVHLSDGTTVDYLIDATDRRFGRKVNGVLKSAYLYGTSSRVVAELDGSGAVVSRFVYGNDNVPAYLIKGGVSFRIIADQVGSVRLVVNSTTGEIAQRIDYDSFGNVLQDTQPGFQPFGFAGGLSDPETGLVRFGWRDYDPAFGRWTAKDPLGFRAGDPNLYRYVRNDPINLSDPLGLSAADDIADEIDFLKEALANHAAKLQSSVSVEVEGVPAIIHVDPETEVIITGMERRLTQLQAIQKLFGLTEGLAQNIQGPLAVYGASKDFVRLASHAGCPGFFDEGLTLLGRRNPLAFAPAMNFRLGEGIINGEIQNPTDFAKVWWSFVNPF